jgi:hypothetical protein
LYTVGASKHQEIIGIMNHQGTKTQREKIPEETDEVAKHVGDAVYAVHRGLGQPLAACLLNGWNVSPTRVVPVIIGGIRHIAI